MDPVETTDDLGPARGGGPNATRLAWGLVLIAVGSLTILHRLDLVDARVYARSWWPVLMMAGGAGALIDSLRRGTGAEGLGLLGAGALLLLHTQGVARLGDTWPLFLMVLGAAMVLTPRRRKARRPHGA